MILGEQVLGSSTRLPLSLYSLPLTSPFLKKMKGSNNYVVSGYFLPSFSSFLNLGQHTESGLPIVCNDPHLPLSTPSFWYRAYPLAATLSPSAYSGLENHLVVNNGTSVTGVSIAGVPNVVIGHNGDIAWGYTLSAFVALRIESYTLSYVDTEDLVLEKLHKTEPNRFFLVSLLSLSS